MHKERESRVSRVLARLLSSENFSIVESNVSKPVYDRENNVLTVPHWSEEISKERERFLLLHECGHVLFTPSTNDPRAVGNPFFVVEDTRVNNLLLKKFPGLQDTFEEHYKDMAMSGLLNPSLKASDDMSLSERMNLFVKSYGEADVSFTQEERTFLRRLFQVSKFEDGLELADDIARYEHKQRGQDNQDDETREEEDEKQESDEQEDQKPENSKKRIEPDHIDPDDPFYEDFVRYVDDDDGEEMEINEEVGDHLKEVENSIQKVEDEMFKSVSVTREFCSVPDKDTLFKTVVPFSKVSKSRIEEIRLSNPPRESLQALYRAFDHWEKEVAMPRVKKMIREFNLRKNAERHSKSLVAKSGKVDPLKISSYRFDDDVFLKSNVIFDDKSHGIFVLVDCSASMQNVIVKAYEEMIIMAIFCHKVGIPFVAYGFTDMSEKRFSGVDFYRKCLSKVPHNIVVDVFQTKNFCILSNHKDGLPFARFDKKTFRQHLFQTWMASRVGDASSFWEKSMGGTPLVEALLMSCEAFGRFVKEGRIDIPSFVLITDGEGQGTKGVKRVKNNVSMVGVRNVEWHGVRYPGQKFAESHVVNRLKSENPSMNFLHIFLEDEAMNEMRKKSRQRSLTHTKEGTTEHQNLDQMGHVFLNKKNLPNVPEIAQKHINAYENVLVVKRKTEKIDLENPFKKMIEVQKGEILSKAIAKTLAMKKH